MAFIHATCGTGHETVAEARECESYLAWEASLVYCSICDGIGHGQPGYGPCPLEETGYWEARADEDRERAMGIV